MTEYIQKSGNVRNSEVTKVLNELKASGKDINDAVAFLGIALAEMLEIAGVESGDILTGKYKFSVSLLDDETKH
jgi:hypothetical protein